MPPKPAEQQPPWTPAECKLRIFHVNDVCELDNLAALRTCVEALSDGLPPSNVLTTIAGNFLGPSMTSTLDGGRGMIAMMNAVPIKACCFGFQEQELPHPALLGRINEYEGVLLNSNMRTFSEREAALAKGKCPDHHVLQLEGGRTVALLGLCSGGGKDALLFREGAFNGHAAQITPPLDAIDDALARARAACPHIDCVIPLTHQRLDDDRALATKHALPVVLGGRDVPPVDEALPNGALPLTGARVVKAGAGAFDVQVVDVEWAADAPPPPAPPTRVASRVVALAQPPELAGFAAGELPHAPHPEMLELQKFWSKPCEALKTAVLAMYDPGALSSVDVATQPSSFATLVGTALRTTERCDAALVRAGSIRGNKLYADGKLTFADLCAECPGSRPTGYVTMRVDGTSLAAAVRESRKVWADGGPTPDAFEAANVLHGDDKLTVDAATGEVTAVGGAPLELDKLYLVAFEHSLLHLNESLKAYAKQNESRVPPAGAGRPVLLCLVQFFLNRVWRQLADTNTDGAINTDELDRLFERTDLDGDGRLTADELQTSIEGRLGYEHGSRILAEQVLRCCDMDQDGGISRAELYAFFQAEAEVGKAIEKAKQAEDSIEYC